MDAKAFFFLVERMRAKQKEYFKTRTSASLTESKTLEKAVDAEIARVRDIVYKKQNPSLWHD
jgi:hypothetical protein